MFNPLASLDKRLLEALVDAGHAYFVRQQLTSPTAGIRLPNQFLICHYKDYSRAREHYDVLADDPFRRLYAWEEAKDRRDLEAAAAGPAGYAIFANLFRPDWEKGLTDELKKKMKGFIHRMGWKPGGAEAIVPYFYPYFGEVYVSLRYRRQEVSVKLSEITAG
jgi:hypothetical protein